MNPRPRLVSPALDPLAEQIDTALGILLTCARAAELLAQGAAELDRLPPYLRARMDRMSVALKASAEDVQAKLGERQ